MTAPVASDTTVDPDRMEIRPLGAADTGAYRRLRQHILEIGEGKFFSSSYTTEQQLTSEAEWRAWCAESALACTIGIFVERELVGVMGIRPCGEAARRIAEWDSTWIDPRYRGSGIARQAYDTVRAWTLARGYRYAVVDIRADNTRSREIREKQGAMYLCTKRDVLWADGSTADVDYFMLNLAPGAERARSPGQAIEFLEAAVAFLTHDAHPEADGARA